MYDCFQVLKLKTRAGNDFIFKKNKNPLYFKVRKGVSWGSTSEPARNFKLYKTLYLPKTNEVTVLRFIQKEVYLDMLTLNLFMIDRPND